MKTQGRHPHLCLLPAYVPCLRLGPNTYAELQLLGWGGEATNLHSKSTPLLAWVTSSTLSSPTKLGHRELPSLLLGPGGRALGGTWH